MRNESLRPYRRHLEFESGLARCAWRLAVVLLVASPSLTPLSHAADASPVVLTNVQQILDLGLETVRHSTNIVLLRGVVTLPVAGASWAYVQDVTAGILVTYTNTELRLEPGQLVEIKGAVGSGLVAPLVMDASARIIGTAPLPEPRRVSADRLAAGESFGQWVQVEGAVRDVARDERRVVLFISAGGLRFHVIIQPESGATLPLEWLDAQVALRGVCWTDVDREGKPMGFTLYVPGANQMTFVRPGSTNIFNRPLTSLKSPEVRLQSDARIRLAGTILFHSPGGMLFLSGDGGAFQARLLVPLAKGNPRMTYLERPPVPLLHPGAKIELIGAPTDAAFAPVLQDAEIRRTGEGPAPAPINVRPAEVLSGQHDRELISLRARVLVHDRRETGPIVTDLFVLQSENTVFEASLESRGTNALTALPKNSLLRVTGICTVRAGELRQPSSFHLLLRDSSDVQSLGQAPPWETLHAGRILAIGGGLGFAALSWIWLLRRRVQHRTAELTHANDMLRTSEARYRTLVENAPEAIVVFDTETGRFIEANENAVRLFGLSRAALLQSSPAQLSPSVQPDGQPSAAGARARIQAALNGNGAPFEWVHRRADGVDFPCEVRVARLPVPGRQLVIGAVTDITERKSAEAEMKHALAKEKQLSELKSSFVSMVSHEFRTPLGVIMSSAEILDSYNERLKPERRSEVLQDIFQSTRRMADLMEEVLLLGRVEAGKVQCKPVPLELSGLCQRLTDELLSATQQRCPILFREHAKLAPALADEALVRLILTNLLSNAVKYSPQGTPVDFTVGQDGADAVFVVRDRGIGIPEADTRELFLAFHRGGNVGDIPGTGLGMVIVKRCVDLHRGSISVESATGIGTTITVRLPVF